MLHKGCNRSVQLENEITGRESQWACRQDELIGGKPPVVTQLSKSDQIRIERVLGSHGRRVR
jgi:hypothetical protein